MIFTTTRLPVYEPLVSYRINRESPESSSTHNLRLRGVLQAKRSDTGFPLIKVPKSPA
jgi:hypothetical protein